MCGAGALARGFCHAGVGARATLADLVTYPDRSFGQDLRAQAAAMSEPSNDIAPGQALQVLAGLAQTNAANFHVTDPELPPHKMIERHAPSDHIAAGPARSQLEVIFLFESFNRLGFNQSEFTIRQWFRESSHAQSIAIAFQPNAGNGVRLIHR